MAFIEKFSISLDEKLLRRKLDLSCFLRVEKLVDERASTYT